MNSILNQYTEPVEDETAETLKSLICDLGNRIRTNDPTASIRAFEIFVNAYLLYRNTKI